jgi:UDP-glucose:(heptosyl)LPS alpha-1,3-glucosyltransferase
LRGYVRVVGLVKRTSERLCFSRADPATRFVCVSEGVSAEMKKYYPKLADRIVTIYNGVDTSTFSPGKSTAAGEAKRAELAIPPERNVAAFVGGEWERKGLRLVLEALPLAPNWDLLVAGRGDQSHYREIAASLGVGKAVHWLGVTREIEVVYSMANAFVLPSRYETFSLVTFEAAASAVPIIAAPVSGVRELIEDEENGFLVDLDPGEIALRLNRLAEEPMLSARLGQAARQSALRFGWDVMVSSHHRLYSQVTPRS